MMFAPLFRKLLCLLPLLFLPPGSISAQQGTRAIMADAMARMMEAMGLFDSAPSRRAMLGAPGSRFLSSPLGHSDWDSLLGAPWGGAGRGPRDYALREMMERFALKSAGPWAGGGYSPVPWKPSRLEGVWEGRGGELLIVQGGRFRIYSPKMQRIDGLIRTKGERLALYDPRNGQAQPFEFAQLQGRLLVRDLSGQVYLYRRLRLDGGLPDGGTLAPMVR